MYKLDLKGRPRIYVCMYHILKCWQYYNTDSMIGLSQIISFNK